MGLIPMFLRRFEIGRRRLQPSAPYRVADSRSFDYVRPAGLTSLRMTKQQGECSLLEASETLLGRAGSDVLLAGGLRRRRRAFAQDDKAKTAGWSVADIRTDFRLNLAFAAGNLIRMPELPDIEAYLGALRTRVIGEQLKRIRIASPFLLRTAEPPLSSVDGHVVRELRRIGKRIVFGFDNDLWLVLHLMIAGRLHWRPLGAKLGGRQNLAAFDFPNGSLVLTEAGSKRRASLQLLAGEEALTSVDPGGIDVFASDLGAFREVLTSENRTLKRALTDPRFLSGIGNAYSDEILHAAQLSPIALTHKLSDEQWKRLFTATRQTLQLWADKLSAEATAGFPQKVTAFRKDMAVHGRYGEPCPRCGEKIQRIRYADNETNYCVRCQTGGKVLADRSLSRLMGSDWPRSLDELEALKRK